MTGRSTCALLEEEEEKLSGDFINDGGLSSTNKSVCKNMTPAPTTGRQSVNYDDVQGPHLSQRGAYQTTNVEAPETERQSISIKSVINHAKGVTAQRDYQDILNMELKDDIEARAQDREPTQTSVKIPNGSDSINMKLSSTLPEKDEYAPTGGVFRQPPVRYC